MLELVDGEAATVRGGGRRRWAGGGGRDGQAADHTEYAHEASRSPARLRWRASFVNLTPSALVESRRADDTNPAALIHGKFRTMPSPSIDSVALDAWPPLPLEAWRDPYDTLHMWP